MESLTELDVFYDYEDDWDQLMEEAKPTIAEIVKKLRSEKNG